MEKRIAPPSYGGKYDDVIEWLKWLEKALTSWRDGGSVNTAVHRLNQVSRHEHAVTWNAASNWDTTRQEAKAKTMKWIEVREAAHDLVASMERWSVEPVTPWNEHIENVKACRLHLQTNNPPADNPIKY